MNFSQACSWLFTEAVSVSHPSPAHRHTRGQHAGLHSSVLLYAATDSPLGMLSSHASSVTDTFLLTFFLLPWLLLSGLFFFTLFRLYIWCLPELSPQASSLLCRHQFAVGPYLVHGFKYGCHLYVDTSRTNHKAACLKPFTNVP